MFEMAGSAETLVARATSNRLCNVARL